jgi:HEAT repeat protein
VYATTLSRAVQEFGVGARKSAPDLAEIVLNSPSKFARVAAANALAGCWPGVSDVLPTLVAALDTAPPPVFMAIVDTLASLGAQAGPAAASLVRGLDDAGTRDKAAAALRRIGKSAVPAIMDTLRRPGAIVRETAARLLGTIGDPDAIPALRVALTDSAPGVREAAATAIAELGPAGHDARTELEIAARDPDVKVRRSATVAIKRLDDGGVGRKR